MRAAKRKPDGERHDERVNLRLTRQELDNITEWAGQAGMTVTDFMRHAVSEDVIRLTRVEQATFPEMTEAVIGVGRALSGIGSDLNKIARLLSGGEPVSGEMLSAVIRMQKDLGAIRRQTADMEEEVNEKVRIFEHPDGQKK